MVSPGFGHYPRDDSELLSIAYSDGTPMLDVLRIAAGREGHPLPAISFGHPARAGDLVLRLSGEDARIEIYAGGGAGISRAFLGRADHPHDDERLRVLDDQPTG
jgi:hypothetical protein